MEIFFPEVVSWFSFLVPGSMYATYTILNHFFASFIYLVASLYFFYHYNFLYYFLIFRKHLLQNRQKILNSSNFFSHLICLDGLFEFDCLYCVFSSKQNTKYSNFFKKILLEKSFRVDAQCKAFASLVKSVFVCNCL